MEEQEKNQPVQEPETTPQEDPAACPSILDKPDHSAWEKKERKTKHLSRQTRNIILALVLCVALVFGSSGVCRILYQKSLFGYLSDRFSGSEATSSETESQVTEEKLIFDYSAYASNDADTDELALGGVTEVLVKNAKDTYTLNSTWATETQTNPETVEEEEIQVLHWAINNVKGRDVKGVKFSNILSGFIISDLFKIAYDSVYAEDLEATIPQGDKTYREECGLDHPTAACTITFGSGAKVTVLVGDNTPTGNMVFLTVQADPGPKADAAGAPKKDTRIYQVKADAVTYYTKEAQYFVDKEILTAVEADAGTVNEDMEEVEDPYFIQGALSYFDELSITGTDYPKPFAFKTVKEDYPGHDSIYLMTSPLTQNVDLTAMEQLLAPLADGLTAADCLVMKGTAADIKSYGLQNPACKVHYKVKGKTYDLLIGQKLSGDSSKYAVMVAGNPSIFSVAAEDLPFVGRTTADYASTTVYSCDITKVRTVQVKMGTGKTTTFTLKHGTDSDGNATLQVTDQSGKRIEEEAFRNMYVDLLSLNSFTNVVDGKDAANPYMTIRLTYNEYKHTDVLRLSPYTDRRYFLSLNGQGSTVVLSSAVEKLEQSYLALVG